jgi:hypothetical protein
MAPGSTSARALVAALLLAATCALHAPVAPRARAQSAAARPPTALRAYNDFDESGMRKFNWNMNLGREPWGFALNAEVWNGRVAMMGFFWVLIQESIVGKGSLIVIKEAQSAGDLIVPGIIGGVFFVLVGALVTVIASSDGDDFSTDEILAELNK